MKINRVGCIPYRSPLVFCKVIYYIFSKYLYFKEFMKNLPLTNDMLLLSFDAMMLLRVGYSVRTVLSQSYTYVYIIRELFTLELYGLL